MKKYGLLVVLVSFGLLISCDFNKKTKQESESLEKERIVFIPFPDDSETALPYLF